MYAIISKNTNEVLALCTSVEKVEAIIGLFNEDTAIRWIKK